MALPQICNVIDTEWEGDFPIEFGISFVNLKTLEISRPISYLIKWENLQISEKIFTLTGISTQKCQQSGKNLAELISVLNGTKYGLAQRLCVSDTEDEAGFILMRGRFSPPRVNVSTLFKLLTGERKGQNLENMLKYFNLEFEGRIHRAGPDSYNIARLFVALIKRMRAGD
jgi:hypothetical protein